MYYHHGCMYHQTLYHVRNVSYVTLCECHAIEAHCTAVTVFFWFRLYPHWDVNLAEAGTIHITAR